MALQVGLLLKQGITPIVCIGEKVRDKDGWYISEIKDQIEILAKNNTSKVFSKIVIAYEPVWAIGTGEVATPQDAQDMSIAIRAKVAKLYSQDVADKVRILYGGSVKAGNIKAIMEQPDVDGALIGGAALDPDEFLRIIRWPDQP